MKDVKGFMDLKKHSNKGSLMILFNVRDYAQIKT